MLDLNTLIFEILIFEYIDYIYYLYTIFMKCYSFDLDIPDRFSLRIAYFSIFFLAVIISAAYSASLTSFLTAGLRKLPFQSLETFVEDGTYELIVVRDTAEYDIFAVSMIHTIDVFPTNKNIYL